MRLGKRGWAVWVLALALIFSCIQAGAAGIYGNVPKGSAAVSKIITRPVSTLPGVEKIVKGHKVTYKIPGLRVIGRRLVIGGPVAKATSVKSISMSSMQSVMGLDDTYNFFSKAQPVDLTIKPSSANYSIATITSSDYDVLDYAVVTAADYDDYTYLALVAQGKTGKATITIKTANGKKAVKTFTVNAQVPFSSMSIGQLKGTSEDDYQVVTIKSKTMYAGDSTVILAQPKPYTATYYDYPYYAWYDYKTSAVTFTSSNENVATISPYGELYAKAPGKATITATARDGSRKKYSFPLTVRGVNPVALEITSANKTLLPDMTYQLKWAIAPYGYYDQKVTWQSSDPSVATVDANGLVTAVSPYSTRTAGSHMAVITGTTNSGRRTDSCTITVSYDKSSYNPKYRFYGIGNDAYSSANPLASCKNDMRLMAAAATNAHFAEVHPYPDQSGDGIRSVLSDMVSNSGIGANDVTFFFYSGHGTSSDSSYYRGALCGVDVDSSSDDGYVTVDEVQESLDRVPGTVVVILDSCLSGQFITSKSLSPARGAAAAKAFSSAWIAQLSGSKASNYSTKALTSSTVRSKYKILTATEPLEDSFGADDDKGFGWFTKWVGLGLGQIPNLQTGGSANSNLKADVNGDKVVTLDELYDYVSAHLPTDSDYAWWDAATQQHAQVWPANDNFPVVNEFGS